MAEPLEQLRRHQVRLRRCMRCVRMTGPPVVGASVVSPVLLVGQAPGPREIVVHKPFAWTAGKTLFSWFGRIGLEEEDFRARVYMAAVCRCFPGKLPTGGDRPPDAGEVKNCSTWLKAEIRLLDPQLIIPVGKLAIGRFLPAARLSEVVGDVYRVNLGGVLTDVIPLPHPSGASTWHRTEPGRSLLDQALRRIARHPAWRRICA